MCGRALCPCPLYLASFGIKPLEEMTNPQEHRWSQEARYTLTVDAVGLGIMWWTVIV